MKKALLLFLILSPLLAFSQSREIAEKLTVYQENKMYELDSNRVVVSAILKGIKGSKDDLYEKAKDYIAEVYSDHNSELKIDNKIDGILEVESVSFSFFSYTAEDTIPVAYHVFYTMRVAIKDGTLHITCSAKDWITEWSTIGFGHKVDRSFIIDCVPIGTKKVFADENKTAEAFLALVDTMHTSIGDLKRVMLCEQ